MSGFNYGDLLFTVNYQSEEASFQLSKYDTVGDFKDEIHEKFGIPPSEQIIECWHKTPESDFQILETCCLVNDCNYMIVYKKDNNGENRNFNRTTDDSSQEIGNDTPDTSASEQNEIPCILSFVHYFSVEYTNRGVKFSICCLEDAISQALQSKSVLLLYFHNSQDAFSKIFCEQLTKPEIQQILKKVSLVCWNIEDDKYKEILLESLYKCSELRYFDRYIQSKTSIAVLVLPVRNSIKVLSVMKGQISPQNFLTTLKQAEEFLINENSIETDISEQASSRHAFGPKDYQQLMLNMLGDRDYDSFEYSEHKSLKEKICYALYGPPQNVEGYEKKQLEKADYLFKIIVEQNNLVAKWKDRVILSIIYNCLEPLPEEKRKRGRKSADYNPDLDYMAVPVFILRKCKHSRRPWPCRIFIDDTGRVYESWNDYLTENKLPEGEMILPNNGRYQADQDGNVILEKHLTPACSIATAVLQGTDIASAVGGIASGGTFVAASLIPAVAAAPFVLATAGIVGAGVGVYSLGRSVCSLIDRNKHKESLNPLESSEARGAYINIVAGTLGFVGAGANIAVSKLAAQGFKIGEGATAAVNVLNVANLGAGGVGVASASYDVLRQWYYENETPSALTIIQLSSSILFFGHAVYNFRTAGAIIEESQGKTLRDYQDSLRSNRHRKTFNKLLKETIRQNKGNIQKGQAEVISTIKNIQNKDEVFATLTRSNKAMNKNNVRFAAHNGEITLNGKPINMATFSSMDKSSVITFLKTLPNTPEPTQAQVRDMSINLQNQFRSIGISEVSYLAFGLVKLFGATDQEIKDKIISAVAQIIMTLTGDPAGYLDILDKIFPNRDKYFRLVNMVNSFFQTLIDPVEEKYQKWKATRDPIYEESIFLKFAEDFTKRAAQIFNIVSEAYFVANNLTQVGLEALLNHFYTWFANEYYAYQNRAQRKRERINHSSPAPRKTCPKCGGYFYSNS